jgi:hypothetical protein
MPRAENRMLRARAIVLRIALHVLRFAQEAMLLSINRLSSSLSDWVCFRPLTL